MSDASSASETIVSKTEQNAVEKVEDSRESDKSSTKSNKSLPSKSTNKLKQSASFKGRTQANVNPPVKRSSFSRPKGRQIPSRPQAVDKAATVAVPKTQTPPKKIVPKKACSTPTNDDVTISDMTLDASCISVVNRTRLPSMPNLLDDSVPNIAPLLKMKAPPIKEGFDNTIVEMPTNTTTVRRHTMVPPRSNPSIGKMGAPRTSAKLKKPLILKGQGANKTICTDTTRSVTNDDDEITDEMMDAAYTRYLQAKFIEMKSRQAREKAEKDSANQLFRAFSATENLRQEMLRKQEESLMWNNIAQMKESLELVETKLAPVLKILGDVNEKFALIASGLDKIKHNLIVQGIGLADQETAARELELLSEMFKKFNEDVVVHKNVIEAEGLDVAKMASEYSNLAEKYTQTIELIKDCKAMLEQADQLANQEASLAISLKNSMAVLNAVESNVLN